MKRFLLLACSIILSVTVLAQSQSKPAAETAAPKHRIGLVNEYTIKPGMMTEFLAWAKNEALPLYIKAGIKESYFFTHVYGDRAIATVTEVHDNFAALKARNDAFGKNNSPEALAALTAGGNRYIEHTRTFIVESLPELSWRNPKMQGIAPYTIMTYLYIAPQRRQDYEAFLKNDWLPLVKKADTNGLVVSRLRYGGDPNQYAVFTRVDDLTELDQPRKIGQVVGAENLAKIQQKLVGIVLRTENRILRLRTDISILPTPNLAEKK
jgi:hypothetical protein